MQKQIKAWAVLSQHGTLKSHQLTETLAIYIKKKSATSMVIKRMPYKVVPCIVTYQVSN